MITGYQHFGVLDQCICKNKQRVHMYEKEQGEIACGLDPGLCCLLHLPRFSEDKSQTLVCKVLRVQ